jgi:hypothetical protein
MPALPAGSPLQLQPAQRWQRRCAFAILRPPDRHQLTTATQDDQQAMPAPDRILELIERFRFNEASYRSGNYNETQVRREFLDPFFKELGWDVDN